MINPPNTSLDRRTADVLRAVVSIYLRHGTPVSSQNVVRYGRLKVSSATVRMVMGKLTGIGLLAQPHQSSGRIPTAAGLRVYIDHLMSPRHIPLAEGRQLTETLSAGNKTTVELMQRASMTLASICHSAAIGRCPRLDDAQVASIEFSDLGHGRVLAVLTLDDQEIHHRIIELGYALGDDDLHRARDHFNERWAGCRLADIRKQLRAVVESSSAVATGSFVDLVRSAIVSLLGRPRIVVAGRSHVLRAEVGFDDASSLLRALDDQEVLLELLDGVAREDGAQVIIGRETRIEAFEPFTVVTAPYRDQHNRMGRLAIVGPVRMDYSKAVSWVSYAARAISGVLDQGVHVVKNAHIGGTR